MKYFYTVFFVFMQLIINAQTNNVININDFEKHFSKLTYPDKNKAIISLGTTYSKTTDSVVRSRIVDFMLDSVIVLEKNCSALAANLLLKYSRINEYDSIKINKLLQILNNGYCNIDIIQLAGCIGDKRFINPIYDIYISDIKRDKLENAILKNTLARLGHEELIQDRLAYFKSIISQKEPIKQEYVDDLRAITYINRKEFYDLLFSYILNEKDKVIIVGSYGGDPFGGDDNIYCTLLSFSLELLSDGIVGFPINQIVCDNYTHNQDIEIVKKWIKTSNNVFQLKKWHPFYGFNYSYW